MSFEETSVHLYSSLRFWLIFKEFRLYGCKRETKIAFRDFSFGLRQRERQIQNTSNFMINVFVKSYEKFLYRLC